MKRNAIVSLLCCFLILFLTGCGRVVDWGKKYFEQGKQADVDIALARNHVRSVRLYDQFEMLGAFDALWLSDDVRIAYANMYAKRRGRTLEQKDVFLRRQLEENDYFISFYLLGLTHDIPLWDKACPWSIFLQVGEKTVSPVEIKAVDMVPEYRQIFGKKFNRFKDTYLVYFNARDIEDNYLINEQIDKIRLIFRSVKKEAELSWAVSVDGKLISDGKAV